MIKLTELEKAFLDAIETNYSNDGFCYPSNGKNSEYDIAESLHKKGYLTRIVTPIIKDDSLRGFRHGFKKFKPVPAMTGDPNETLDFFASDYM